MACIVWYEYPLLIVTQKGIPVLQLSLEVHLVVFRHVREQFRNLGVEVGCARIRLAPLGDELGRSCLRDAESPEGVGKFFRRLVVAVRQPQQCCLQAIELLPPLAIN